MTLSRTAIIAGLYAFLGLFLLLPLWTVLSAGLEPALLAEVLRSPIHLQCLASSFGIAAETSLLSLLLALPLAWIAHRHDFPGRALASALLLLPLILPPFVGALGVLQVFGHSGILNTLLGTIGLPRVEWLGETGRFHMVCALEALHLYPILYLNLLAALDNIDPSLDDAARNLGIPARTRFLRITLPLLRPGLFAGLSLVFAWSLTELGTPLMLGYTRAAPVQIFNGAMELDSNPLAYALAVVLLLASSGTYLLARYGSRQAVAGGTKGGTRRLESRLAGRRALLAWIPFAIVASLAALPHLCMILLALGGDWYQTLLPATLTLSHFSEALAHPLVVPGIANSFQYAGLATLLCLGIGGLAALACARWKPRGWQLLDALVMLPLAVPGLIIAIGYLGMTLRHPELRRWLDPIRDPLFLLVVAYAVRRLPHAVRTLAAGLEQIPEDLEAAAKTLGAGTLRIWRKILAPLLAANVAAAALFVFSFSVLEVSDSLLLAQRQQFFPLPRVILELSQILGPGLALASALGSWAMLLLATTLAAAILLIGRRAGRLFS